MVLLLSLEQSTLDILELFVLLSNFSANDFLVEKGNRIAQIISQKCEVLFVEVETVDIFSETDFEYLVKEKSILRGVLAVLVLQVCNNFLVKKKF